MVITFSIYNLNLYSPYRAYWIRQFHPNNTSNRILFKQNYKLNNQFIRLKEPFKRSSVYSSPEKSSYKHTLKKNPFPDIAYSQIFFIQLLDTHKISLSKQSMFDLNKPLHYLIRSTLNINAATTTGQGAFQTNE